jgi:hypothetical protein
MKAGLFVLITILTAVWLVLPSNSTAVGPPARFSLKELPDPYRGESKYKVDPYIAAAAKLQAAGRDKAIATLHQGGRLDSAIVLSRMLFTAKPNKEFRRPMLGAAVFLGGTTYKDWPLEPIEVVDGIPFLVVWGYILFGQREDDYPDYCVRECNWNSAVYKPKSAEEKKKALRKLLASPKWKKPLSGAEKAFLTAQIK